MTGCKPVSLSRRTLHHGVSIPGDSGGICNTLGNDSMCDSKQKSSYEHGSDFERLSRYGEKKITDHPATTNSNYVINNITANITRMQVLTIVLLMICNGQNPGSSTSGTSHNKCSKMPPPTSMHKCISWYCKTLISCRYKSDQLLVKL